MCKIHLLLHAQIFKNEITTIKNKEAMIKMNEKLVKSCNEVVAVFEKLKMENYKDLSAKLEWCIGSYKFDKNPSGLIETGAMALYALKEFKTKNPRKVSKKVIENLEKVISGYSQN